MLRTRIISSAKPLWVTGNEIVSCYGTMRLSALVAPSFALPPPQVRSVHFDSPTRAIAARDFELSFFRRVARKMGVGKYKRRMSGYLLYEDIVAKTNYLQFFSDFKMPDTFYSWFVITELHVWMLMTRCMAEGHDGQDLRNHIVEAMWSDVNARKSKLGKSNKSALKKQVSELSSQFNAAIIGYDEGITSDDKVLAGALWRRLFQCQLNNPETLEILVAYVRKQMVELDKLPSEDILSLRSIEWLDYRNP